MPLDSSLTEFEEAIPGPAELPPGFRDERAQPPGDGTRVHGGLEHAEHEPQSLGVVHGGLRDAVLQAAQAALVKDGGHSCVGERFKNPLLHYSQYHLALSGHKVSCKSNRGGFLERGSARSPEVFSTMARATGLCEFSADRRPVVPWARQGSAASRSLPASLPRLCSRPRMQSPQHFGHLPKVG